MAKKKPVPAGYRITSTTDGQNIGTVLEKLPARGDVLTLGDSNFDVIASTPWSVASYNYVINIEIVE